MASSDNVASHANGRGYSALQVYADHAEFAVCDTGHGFLRNVRRVEKNIDTARGAIEWALRKGNTTAKRSDDFAQREHEDWDDKPEENHHMGIGLWRLVRLVEETSGRLWIWSGDVTYQQTGKKRSYHNAPVEWPGVMIELEVPKLTNPPQLGDFERDAMNELAAELGI